MEFPIFCVERVYHTLLSSSEGDGILFGVVRALNMCLSGAISYKSVIIKYHKKQALEQC